ncbi:MAG: alpha-amylase [Saprospiraceae bacterium]|nr:alpha-amylase [Saprospiraceae bacterium]
MIRKILIFLIVGTFFFSCQPVKETTTSQDMPFTWDNATIYFMMTDRFNNGDVSNDFSHPEVAEPAPYRGFMGGDIVGITQKINEGYFNDLGVNAIWMTPIVQQIEGSVDEGTGTSYAFHGYWTRDWTALDPRFGTGKDLKDMIDAAHANGIRILIDAVANHTGPVTPMDSQWPDSWVKTSPQCRYQDFETTVNCTLVENLPDVRTESDQEVELPPFLVQKWKSEGRYDQEVAELDTWFTETGYPRTPVYYILKWLVDFVKDYGIDGFRVDTVKHTEGYLWKDLYESAAKAFEDWKRDNPEAKLDDLPFYMVGEVYGYYAINGRDYNYGDTIVDFFDEGFTSMINFGFKDAARSSYDSIFSRYDAALQGPLAGKTIVHYVSSHDDGSPFDPMREKPIEAGTKLLLCPGGVQIYYGDESARNLNVEAAGDARLRSFMNWDEVDSNADVNGNKVKDVLTHWQKLGQFRNAHPAVGAGKHQKISDAPYTFSRVWSEGNVTDKVVVALDAGSGKKTISVGDVFADGTTVKDHYSGVETKVVDGQVEVDSEDDVVLISQR